MSVTMTRTDGVTVLTLTSDPESSLPPICQILKSLCYSPVWCSVSQRLRRIQGSSQSALGTLQIMVGLLNIGLGVIVLKFAWDFWWNWREINFPFWFGGWSILFGAVSILSEKCPSPCLVVLNVILNVAGATFAIIAVVFYSFNITRLKMEACSDYDWKTISSPYTDPELLEKKCWEGLKLMNMFLRSINALMIVLSVLELCVTFSSAVLGFKALRRRGERENEVFYANL